ncbi:hypothetical protein SCP_1601390 [Sparassis crispa]|uniref:Uncharacterized protein n=1 Tax=Sparassis crispa TaxID=139825 RepID=A0A401H4W8_9APHY|nr:hypothetical protein SCP_1601390 [Sparassis crispa]GBE89477.1 hypothetical protein SCP_1601390 [Sparassis crispa]
MVRPSVTHAVRPLYQDRRPVDFRESLASLLEIGSRYSQWLIGAELRRLFFLRRRCLPDEAKAMAEDKDEDVDEDGDVARDQHRGSPIRTIPLIEQYAMEEMPGCHPPKATTI